VDDVVKERVIRVRAVSLVAVVDRTPNIRIWFDREREDRNLFFIERIYYHEINREHLPIALQDVQPSRRHRWKTTSLLELLDELTTK
jgi:hypothetical protein